MTAFNYAIGPKAIWCRLCCFVAVLHASSPLKPACILNPMSEQITSIINIPTIPSFPGRLPPSSSRPQVAVVVKRCRTLWCGLSLIGLKIDSLTAVSEWSNRFPWTYRRIWICTCPWSTLCSKHETKQSETQFSQVMLSTISQLPESTHNWNRF